jgi:hypothetical protein
MVVVRFRRGRRVRGSFRRQLRHRRGGYRRCGAAHAAFVCPPARRKPPRSFVVVPPGQAVTPFAAGPARDEPHQPDRGRPRRHGAPPMSGHLDQSVAELHRRPRQAGAADDKQDEGGGFQEHGFLLDRVKSNEYAGDHVAAIPERPVAAGQQLEQLVAVAMTPAGIEQEQSLMPARSRVFAVPPRRASGPPRARPARQRDLRR